MVPVVVQNNIFEELKMEKISKKVRTIIIVGIPSLLVFIFIYFSFVLPRIIEKSVHVFCDNIAIGTSQEVVIEKARFDGLKINIIPPKIISPDDLQTTIRVWNSVAFNRYFCTLRILDGKVTSKKTTYVD